MLQSCIGPLDIHASHSACGFGRPPHSPSARRRLRIAAPARNRPSRIPASPSSGRSRTASGCSAARPISSATSIANRAGSQLAAEHQLERATGGRGWAQNQVDHLCVNAAGAVLDTCDRDGERENYLAPKTHLVVARLAGAVPAGATCNWSFDDGTIPPKQVNAPCSQPVQQRLPTASRPSPPSASRGRTTASTASRPRSRSAIC